MVDTQRTLEVAAGLTTIGGYGAIPTILDEFGCDCSDILSLADLPLDLFEDGGNLISGANLSALMRTCTLEAKCLHFGLLVGQRRTLSSLGMLGDLIRCSRTIEEALKALVKYHPLQDRTAELELNVQGSVAILNFAVYANVEHADTICDAAIAGLVTIMRELCGKDWQPVEVLLPRYRPAYLKPYRDLFRSPLRFEEETAALVFDREWLAQPLTGGDRILVHVLESRLSAADEKKRVALKDELRRLLRLELLRKKGSAEYVATLFDMHHRTFHRRLKAEGTSLRIISNEIRLEIARQLLADTHIPLSQIAAALAFSEASAFTRAFRRWTGGTPTEYREAHRDQLR